MHHGPLIATIVMALVVAFAFGALAQRLRISPLVGYLLGGVAVGPFTPGFVADQPLAAELAEIGVILLMFGVGLHFSLRDLMAVRSIAVPGALVQIAVATLLGMGLATFLGWPLSGGIVFGLALSVASTVVLLRALQGHRLVETEQGRIAVGWLIVEDLAMVLALVLLPAIGGGPADTGLPEPLLGGLDLGLAGTVLVMLAKVGAFVAFMLIAGRRLLPALLHWVAQTGSRELFRLAVLAVALGVAYAAAELFGVSFALGAFFAGMVLSGSPLSQRAAEELLPLRDAFAVLFFVSVGMLFDPSILVRAPLEVAATLAIILVGKSLAAFMIVRAFGWPVGTSLIISASLAQIGEFSFILAGLGVALGLLPEVGRDLILAGAILSIFANPFVFALALRWSPGDVSEQTPTADASTVPPAPPTATSLTGHTVIVGYGRVGRTIGAELRRKGQPFLVIEDRLPAVEAARGEAAEVVVGNAADPRTLATANLAEARRLFVAIPESFEAGQVVQQARAANPDLEIVARAHSSAEAEHLAECGATASVMAEEEVARGMLERTRDPQTLHAAA